MLPAQIVRTVTASSSCIASATIATMIMLSENGLKTLYSRIIFGLSIANIMQSAGILASPLAAPSDTPNAPWAIGNTGDRQLWSGGVLPPSRGYCSSLLHSLLELLLFEKGQVQDDAERVFRQIWVQDPCSQMALSNFWRGCSAYKKRLQPCWSRSSLHVYRTPLQLSKGSWFILPVHQRSKFTHGFHSDLRCPNWSRFFYARLEFCAVDFLCLLWRKTDPCVASIPRWIYICQ